MIGWTNMADGGVNIQNGKAVIHVLAQVGSTINFLKDGITIILKPDKSFVDIANNDLAHWYYSISPSNYGTWTVTATLGTDTISDIVLITSNEEYDIALIYGYMFVKNGMLNTRFPWYIDETGHSGSSITQESGSVLFVTGGNITTVFSTQNPVDFTNYTTLRITVTSGASYRGGNYMPCIGVGRNRPTSGGSPTSISGIDAFTLLNTQTGAIQGTYTIDISALNGLYYVDLVLGGSVKIPDESGFVHVTQFGLYE